MRKTYQTRKFLPVLLSAGMISSVSLSPVLGKTTVFVSDSSDDSSLHIQALSMLDEDQNKLEIGAKFDDLEALLAGLEPGHNAAIKHGVFENDADAARGIARMNIEIAGKAASGAKAPSIMFLVDQSGSMNMYHAQDNTIEVMNCLNPSHYYYIPKNTFGNQQDGYVDLNSFNDEGPMFSDWSGTDSNGTWIYKWVDDMLHALDQADPESPSQDDSKQEGGEKTNDSSQTEEEHPSEEENPSGEDNQSDPSESSDEDDLPQSDPSLMDRHSSNEEQDTSKENDDPGDEADLYKSLHNAGETLRALVPSAVQTMKQSSQDDSSNSSLQSEGASQDEANENQPVSSRIMARAVRVLKGKPRSTCALENEEPAEEPAGSSQDEIDESEASGEEAESGTEPQTKPEGQPVSQNEQQESDARKQQAETGFRIIRSKVENDSKRYEKVYYEYCPVTAATMLSWNPVSQHYHLVNGRMERLEHGTRPQQTINGQTDPDSEWNPYYSEGLEIGEDSCYDRAILSKIYLQNFIRQFLDENPGSKAGVILFAQDCPTYFRSPLTSDYEELDSILNYTNGGAQTNFQAGFQGLLETILTDKDQLEGPLYTVFITDGMPNQPFGSQTEGSQESFAGYESAAHYYGYQAAQDYKEKTKSPLYVMGLNVENAYLKSFADKPELFVNCRTMKQFQEELEQIKGTLSCQYPFAGILEDTIDEAYSLLIDKDHPFTIDGKAYTDLKDLPDSISAEKRTLRWKYGTARDSREGLRRISYYLQASEQTLKKPEDSRQLATSRAKITYVPLSEQTQSVAQQKRVEKELAIPYMEILNSVITGKKEQLSDKGTVIKDASVLAKDESITYRLSFTNTGKAPLDNLQVADPLPKGLSYQSGGTLKAGRVLFVIEHLDPDQSAVVTFQANVNGQAADMVNQAWFGTDPARLNAKTNTVSLRLKGSPTKPANDPDPDQTPSQPDKTDSGNENPSPDNQDQNKPGPTPDPKKDPKPDDPTPKEPADQTKPISKQDPAGKQPADQKTDDPKQTPSPTGTSVKTPSDKTPAASQQTTPSTLPASQTSYNPLKTGNKTTVNERSTVPTSANHHTVFWISLGAASLMAAGCLMGMRNHRKYRK